MTSRPREPLIIADASPLISLAKIDQLALLRQVALEVWVPTMVWREITAGSDQREIERLTDALRDCIREPEASAYARFCREVDAGEAAALALASERPDAILLIDDAEGRRVAAAHSFRYFGTVGLLLRAKRLGLIESLSAEIAAIVAAGLYLDEAVIREVLKAAGEA